MKRFSIAAVTAAALAPHPAAAHLASTGLGPVYDGIWHFALTPEQALPMAALALFAGRRGPAQARAVLFALPPAWFLTSLAGASPGATWQAIIGAASVFTAGALLAADISVGPRVAGATALLLGGALGWVYGLPAGDGAAALPAALGAATYVFALVALLASVSLPLHRLPAIIAVRVAGSWTAALGLLLVGWWVHGRT